MHEDVISPHTFKHTAKSATPYMDYYDIETEYSYLGSLITALKKQLATKISPPPCYENLIIQNTQIQYPSVIVTVHV